RWLAHRIDFGALSVDANESRSDERGLALRRFQNGINRPVFDWNKRFDFLLALHDQAHRNGLHAARGESATYLVPEQRRNLIPDDAIQNPTRLLRVYQVLVHVTSLIKGGFYGIRRDFVKRDAMDRVRLHRMAQFIFQMRRDSLAFAIGIGREIHTAVGLRQLAQPI